MNTTELDPKFKEFLVNYHHLTVVRGVIVFVVNALVSIVIILDKDSRATSYRFYLLALHMSSMITDLLLDAYTPILVINSRLIFSESSLANLVDIVTLFTVGVIFFGGTLSAYFCCVFYRRCVVIPAGSRFCWFGWRRYLLFIILLVNIMIVALCFVIVVSSARVPAKDVPVYLSWLCSMPSYIHIDTSPYFYSAAAYAGSSAVVLFGSIVLMIWQVQKELRKGIRNASGATQRVQKRAITALTLQGIIPSVCFVIPGIGICLIYFRSLSQDLEEAANDRRASSLSALLFAVFPLHTFMHSLTVIACSPSYRRTIRDAICRTKHLRQRKSATLFVSPYTIHRLSLR